MNPELGVGDPERGQAVPIGEVDHRAKGNADSVECALCGWSDRLQTDVELGLSERDGAAQARVDCGSLARIPSCAALVLTLRSILAEHVTEHLSAPGIRPNLVELVEEFSIIDHRALAPKRTLHP